MSDARRQAYPKLGDSWIESHHERLSAAATHELVLCLCPACTRVDALKCCTGRPDIMQNVLLCRETLINVSTNNKHWAASKVPRRDSPYTVEEKRVPAHKLCTMLREFEMGLVDPNGQRLTETAAAGNGEKLKWQRAASRSRACKYRGACLPALTR